jgi:hypothetical protein
LPTDTSPIAIPSNIILSTTTSTGFYPESTVIDITVKFTELVNTIALMNDIDSAKEVFRWFGKILTKYDPIMEGNGQTWNCDGDFYKFIGHELFVHFITPFLREEKWGELREILSGTLLVGPTQHNRSERKESWTELSEHSPWLMDEGRSRRRLSFHGDLLKDRHEQVELAKIVPFRDFADTDFFLHLFGTGKTQEKYHGAWYPRSDIWIKDTPRFISEAINYPIAMRICNALQINDIEELKKRLGNLTIKWDWRSPVSEKDISDLGTEGGGQIIT